MKAYQADIAKFEAAGAKVFGVSTDNTPSQSEWGKKEGIQVPILSDFKDREVSKAYGVLTPNGVSARTTFVIDADGKIQHIEDGAAAIEHAGALAACSRLKK